MAINRITSTPIIVNTYNARALTCNKSIAKNCVVLPDGTLYALVGDFAGKIHLLTSTDNGFSWTFLRQAVETELDMREQTGFNQDGLAAHLVIDERFRILDVYMGAYESVGSNGFVDRGRYDLDDITGTAPTEATILDTSADPFQGWCSVCHNHEEIFLVWVDATGDLNVTRCSPRTTSTATVDSKSDTNLFNFFDCVCDEDGHVYIVYEDTVSTERILYFTIYSSKTGSFTSEVEIENFGSSPEIGNNFALAIDGLGNLCVTYYSQNQEEVKYATSIDDGDTWDVNTVSLTSGHSGMVDLITSDKVGRTNIIGGSLGGFILTYGRNNGSLKKCYVRQLTTSDDGATYDLQEEREVATKEPYNTEDIVGVQFFHPPDTKLLDLSDPGKVRIAFTVGEGNSTIMSDTWAISVGQELLSESAYPTTLSSEDSTNAYSTDTADSVSLLVDFAAIAGPGSNIDFYGAGMIGTFTNRYLNAFNEIGNHCRLLRFDPKSDNFMSDKTAFGVPTEYEVPVLFDPVTYSFPSPALNRATLIERVEVDVRKLHIPPDFHLGRIFSINKGGYLKRTVWLIEYDGNQYEISQIIPRFIRDEICFYECNAYVVGPSRDPFARVVLPSET